MNSIEHKHQKASHCKYLTANILYATTIVKR